MFHGKINTFETQPACSRCRRKWADCPQTQVWPDLVWRQGDRSLDLASGIQEVRWMCEDCRNKKLADTKHYCFTCRKSHPISTKCPQCALSGVEDGNGRWHGPHLHAPLPADAHLDFSGWRFTAPFICMACGIEICLFQFAFSRTCGPCDVSNSTTHRFYMSRQCFAGPREKLPTWSKKHGHRGDIPEEAFVDPARRLEFQIVRIPQRRRA